MKKEKLEITKNNYEGYTKLYDTYFFDKKDEPRIYKAILGGVFMLGIGFCGVIFSPVPLLFSAVLPLSIGLTIGSVRDIILEKQDELKKQYPDLNYKIPKQELEESLKEVGIVTKDDYGYPSVDVTRFEETLQKFEETLQKFEEEKEKHFMDQSRNYSSFEDRNNPKREANKVIVKKKKN